MNPPDRLSENHVSGDGQSPDLVRIGPFRSSDACAHARLKQKPARADRHEADNEGRYQGRLLEPVGGHDSQQDGRKENADGIMADPAPCPFIRKGTGFCDVLVIHRTAGKMTEPTADQAPVCPGKSKGIPQKQPPQIENRCRANPDQNGMVQEVDHGPISMGVT